MPTTYLDLCNQVLRRLNEVEIVAADFPTVRGVHALVKDAVQSAIARLNQAEYSWPFNAADCPRLYVRMSQTIHLVFRLGLLLKAPIN
jgi:hypothetical protein